MGDSKKGDAKTSAIGMVSIDELPIYTNQPLNPGASAFERYEIVERDFGQLQQWVSVARQKVVFGYRSVARFVKPIWEMGRSTKTSLTYYSSSYMPSVLTRSKESARTTLITITGVTLPLLVRLRTTGRYRLIQPSLALLCGYGANLYSDGISSKINSATANGLDVVSVAVLDRCRRIKRSGGSSGGVDGGDVESNTPATSQSKPT